MPDDKFDSARLEAHLAKKRKKSGAAYATTSKRALAYTVDHMIISSLSFILGFVINIFNPAPAFELMPPELQITFDASGMPTANIAQIPTTDEAMVMIAEHWASQMSNFAPLFSLSFLLPMVYFSMFIASRWQATPGMRWCKMIVTDRQGNALSLLHATWRTLAHFLTYLTLGIGFFTANLNNRRLALHDWIAGTEVRKYDPEFEAERKRRTEEAKAEALRVQAQSLDRQQTTKPARPATHSAPKGQAIPKVQAGTKKSAGKKPTAAKPRRPAQAAKPKQRPRPQPKPQSKQSPEQSS